MNSMPGDSHNMSLLLFTLITIVALVVLIARFKLHPFLGLMLAAIAIGLHSGMKLPVIAKTFQEGVGNTLGFLGVVVGLGIMLGKMLAESGGAHVVAQHFMRWLGPNKRCMAKTPFAARNCIFATGTS